MEPTKNDAPQGPASPVPTGLVRETHDLLKEHMEPQLHLVEIEDTESLQALVHPRGHAFLNLEGALAPLRAAPRRATGTSTHQTFESFVAHVSTFGANPGSAVFVDVNGQTPKAVAVFNYGAPGQPAWRDHRAELALPFSEDWLAWRNAAAAGAMPQGGFAEFLENRLVDVLDPAEVKRSAPSAQAVADSLGIAYATQAQLLGLSRSLNVRVDVKVEQSQNLASGEGKLVFEETHETKSEGQTVKVPGGFAIAIAVFRGDATKSVIPVRLRYRVAGGRVAWSLLPHRADDVLRLAVNDMVGRIAAATHLPVYAGAPEGPQAS